MIKDSEKQQIKTKLKAYCERYDSQNKAAKSLKGVSSATISQVLNDKWELIADEMWRNIASQTGYSFDEWVYVETANSKIISDLLDSSRGSFKRVKACIGNAGCGKSTALRLYAENNKEVYLVQCDEHWNRKIFMQELLAAMGRDHRGMSIHEMVRDAVKTLKGQASALVIFDEIDKLPNDALYFFITLYNKLEYECSIMLFATKYLKKRIERGVNHATKGFPEIYSRLKKKFVELDSVSTSDIVNICIANGITEKSKIREVIEESQEDLRCVRDTIQGYKYFSNID